ncbi:MAG: DUF2804 domain-containing protein [Candidatus Lernaella stagnicola]|nr:DUF2804 domain-containing protein [Candidatus Lernaella stagnicola]
MAPVALTDAPAILIAENGIPNYGNFRGPIAECNHECFDYTGLQRWPWSALHSTADKLLKRWQFVGVIDEGFVLGAAVIHLQYAGAGFAYVYDRNRRQLAEKNLKSPLAKNTAFSRSAAQGVSEIRVGNDFIRMQNTPADGRRELHLRCGEITAEVAFSENGDGVSTVTRMAMYGFGHTYKFVGLPATGHIVVGGEKVALSDKAMAILDWSSATPPRNTIWNWAAAAGHAASGKAVGVNFSTGLITSGYTENTVWIDGQPHMIGGVNFDYDQRDVLGKPWRVWTPEGDVDLEFTPDHERFEAANLLIAASRLHQPFGQFEGEIKVGRTKHDVTLYGFCEEHFAKW